MPYDPSTVRILPNGLATVEIYYFRPDHPVLLQQFLHQLEDHYPEYPCAHKFLRFWRREIHAVVQSIVLSHSLAQARRKEIVIARSIHEIN